MQNSNYFYMMYGSTQLGVAQYGASISSPMQTFTIYETFTLSEHIDKAISKTVLETFTLSEHIDKARTITALETFTLSEWMLRTKNGENTVWVRIPKTSTSWTSLPKP